MVATEEETRALLSPSYPQLSKWSGTSNGKTLNTLSRDMTQAIVKEHSPTNGLQMVKRPPNEILPTNTNHLFSHNMRKQKELESIQKVNMDLAALLQGTVKCTKKKPVSTKETRKEAFHRYMKIIYGLPYNIKVDLEEDRFDPDRFSFQPVPYTKPHKLPAIVEDVCPVKVKKKMPELQKKKAHKPEIIPKPLTPKKVKKTVVIADPAVEEEPVIVEEPQKVIIPVEEPKAPTPPPAPCPKTSLPQFIPQPPVREPSPELPQFLKEFADTDWFRELYPDTKSVPSSLSPKDFSRELLVHLSAYSTPSRVKILAALQTLHTQGFIQTDTLHQGLIDAVSKVVKPHMTLYEQAVLGQMLNLILCLKPDSCELIIKLLTLLAYKELGLRERILHMLKALGVNEAEQWLSPELESWVSERQNPSDVWMNLHYTASSWLQLWTSKYKQDYNRSVFLKSTENTVVDVLNYFCSIQKEEYTKAKKAAPARIKNTVLLPLYNCVSHPIHRLGETYTMARTRRPAGVILPPLRNRPSLMQFPNFISFPLPRVTLSPFYNYSEDWLKVFRHRYFILQQSYVEYYR